MATEEQSNSPPAAPNQPDYPKMIMAAIDSISDQSGSSSSKAAISQYIESNNSDLPAAHSTLLDYYLKKMKVSGELVMEKGNYTKPDPNAPAKRGRGRPPKVSTTPPDGSVAPSPPRSRGRPPKAKGPAAPPPQPKKTSSSIPGRKRGRPAKEPKLEEEEAPPASVAEGNSVKRGRGRPPKVKPTVVPIGA